MTQGNKRETAPGYALFLDLTDQKVVIVGGGPVAQRKTKSLLSHGARVTVVAPDLTDCLRELADAGNITWLARAYQPGDLSGARLVFSACGDPEANAQIKREAEALGTWLNVADDPSLCDFTVPSTLNRGALQIAVSTSGCAPAEARRVRQQLESQFDQSWGAYLNLLRDVRELAKQQIVANAQDRRAVLAAATDAGWRQRIAAGENIDPVAALMEAATIAGVSL